MRWRRVLCAKPASPPTTPTVATVPTVPATIGLKFGIFL
jgi:hypothetical protein